MITGLKALHDLKVCHRDIKCANIFLTSKGEIKLGDFNVSKVAKKGMLYTQTGTPYYASPEVWKDKPYDYKSDIWSLACVLYEMATLRPPFKAPDMKSLYKKVVAVDYPPISSKYSADLSGILKVML
jgi:NIMA (never in mitosis gene a)-related kinase